jgi:Asp-tRNA(Asn)/Glu-tRNA(Gln) amidotransferase A subunit family amidase
LFLFLGKTALSQWANYRSGNSSNGWSSRGGQVFGAYIPKQDPSGSSSGSGVAAAIGLATVTLGSETDGSIISPSQRNSVVGLKPTVGLTSSKITHLNMTMHSYSYMGAFKYLYVALIIIYCNEYLKFHFIFTH